MTRNQNDDDDASWSDLNHDVLLLVMMRLGVIAFVSFGGVCKSWRSLALSNKKRFMASRPPVPMYISTDANEKECYCRLNDFEGRKFKNLINLIPHLAGRECVGLTCGYMVLFGRETKDFWLVNPITRHQLHFPDFPLDDFPFHPIVSPLKFGIGAILVFSPSISEWVFIMFDKFFSYMSFCIAGNGAWNHVSTTFPIRDLHAFKGKIYVISTGGRVYEMRLHPEPKLTSLEIKNFMEPHFLYPKFVSSGKNLYVMDHGSQDGLEDMFKVQELDFDKMKWVMPNDKTIEKYAFFASKLTASASVIMTPDPLSQYKRYAFYIDKSEKYNFFVASMWYFPHECMNVNLIDE